MAQSVCCSQDTYSSEDWWAGNSQELHMDQGGKHSSFLIFFFFRNKMVEKHLSGHEGLHSTSGDLFHNNLGSWIVLEEEDEEARKAPDNQGRSNEWKVDIKKYWARMDGQKKKGKKVRVWRKKCPSLGLCDMWRGLRSNLRTALDNAASVSLDRQWIQLGKVIIPSDSNSGGVESSSLPTTWSLNCLIWGAGRGQREGAEALVYCSLTLLPTSEHFIPLGDAAVTVLSLQRRQQGVWQWSCLPRVMPAFRSLLGAIWCLFSNMEIKPM